MRLLFRLFGVLSLFSFCLVSCGESWVRLYKKRFSKSQAFRNRTKERLVFEKKSLSPFSQLVFSWNAFRPRSGHFSFSVQVQDAKTKLWSPWYKMMEWGQGIQQSYYGKKKGNTRYVYVRLEVEKKNLANGFRIKINRHHGASFGLLRGFSVCTADFNKFKPEIISKHIFNLPSVCVKGVPKKSQMILNHPRANHMCSPTSCSMLVSFLSRKKVDPLMFAYNSFDKGLDTYGSWPFNIAYAFDRCGGNYFFSTIRFCSFKDLHQQLSRGIPVVVSVRGFLQGAPKTYNKGHLLVVVGWDSKKRQVICHDPALESDKKTLKRYGIRSFLPAWECSHRLAYFAEPNLLG